MTDNRLDVVDESGKRISGRIVDLLPSRTPDLYKGDQLVVLGRYLGGESLRFRLSGLYFGEKKAFEFSFDLTKATVRNAFVPRLWASRKIAVLSDAIRQFGADSGIRIHRDALRTDPRIKELVEEIVRLSTRFGVLSEYTAFLAVEGTDLFNTNELVGAAERHFQKRAMNTRTGLGAVNQSINSQAQVSQQELNRNNTYYDSNMNRVSITNVQQVNDLTFFQREGTWVDSRLYLGKNGAGQKEVVEVGSEKFYQLVRKLARQGRSGCMALSGDILLKVNGNLVLLKAPAQ